MDPKQISSKVGKALSSFWLSAVNQSAELATNFASSQQRPQPQPLPIPGRLSKQPQPQPTSYLSIARSEDSLSKFVLEEDKVSFNSDSFEQQQNNNSSSTQTTTTTSSAETNMAADSSQTVGDIIEETFDQLASKNLNKLSDYHDEEVESLLDSGSVGLPGMDGDEFKQ